MSTAQLYSCHRAGTPTKAPTFSFELYPPRAHSRLAPVWAQVSRLIDAAPDYVSVTYGASGANRNTRDRSVQVLMQVLDQHPGLPAVAHLTCVGMSEPDTTMIIRLLMRSGVRDFLALRGDLPPEGTPRPDNEIARTVDLVRLIRAIAHEEFPLATTPDHPDYVSIAVAAYPASHGRARDNELAALAEKSEAGADYAISQVFYDVEEYGSLVRELRLAGCRLPIVPGILPLTNVARLQALERLAGVKVPEWLLSLHQEADARKRIASTLNATLTLIDGVLKAGAPGIHIYTFNRARPTLDLIEHLKACGYLRRRESMGGDFHEPPGLDSGAAELVNLALHKLPPTYSSLELQRSPR